MIRKEKKDYLIQSVSLACTLLEQFGGAASELKISELSRLLCVSKNNVFRLLATLESHNFIEKNSKSGAYQLGLTSLKLGESCIKEQAITPGGSSFTGSCLSSEHGNSFPGRIDFGRTRMRRRCRDGAPCQGCDPNRQLSSVLQYCGRKSDTRLLQRRGA